MLKVLSPIFPLLECVLLQCRIVELYTVSNVWMLKKTCVSRCVNNSSTLSVRTTMPSLVLSVKLPTFPTYKIRITLL